MQTKYISSPSDSRPGLLRKIIAIVWTVALIGLALMFSAVLLTAISDRRRDRRAYLWWKTRTPQADARTEQNFPPPGAQTEGDVQGRSVFRRSDREGEPSACMSLTPASNAESDSAPCGSQSRAPAGAAAPFAGAACYPVEIAAVLHRLAEQVDQNHPNHDRRASHE
jgi:hypothetical protein